MPGGCIHFIVYRLVVYHLIVNQLTSCSATNPGGFPNETKYLFRQVRLVAKAILEKKVDAFGQCAFG